MGRIPAVPRITAYVLGAAKAVIPELGPASIVDHQMLTKVVAP